MEKKRRGGIVLLLLAVMVIAVSCKMAFKGQSGHMTESYGVTSDGQITIENEMEVILQFEIPRDHFQGITIRLSPSQCKFEEEMLDFVLLDRSSGETLAEYDMYLKNEVYGSESFVRLPVENSAGREVELHIIGTNIHNVPYLYVSEQKNLDAVMYLNTSKRKNVLVFSAVYDTGSSVNIQWLVKGGVLLFLLLLAYFWPAVPEEKQDGKRGRGKWAARFSAIVDFCRRYAAMLGFWLLTGLYGALMLFVYKAYVSDEMAHKETRAVVQTNKKLDKLKLNADSRQWELCFQSEKRSLSSLLFWTEVKDCDPDARLHVQVYDGDGNICYHDGYVRVKEIEKQGKKWRLFLKKEFTYSEGQKVLVHLEPVDFGATELIFQTGAGDTEYTLYEGGELMPSMPALSAVYSDNSYLKRLFEIFCVLGYGFFLLIYWLFVIRKCPVERAYVPVILYLGTLYMLVIPVYSVPDEYAHIDSAYIVSNRMLGIPVDLDGYEYKRAADVETGEAPEFTTTLADYRRLYTSLFEKTDDTQLVSCYTKNAVANANVLCFLPAAIGITIARSLDFGTLPMFFLGRFMNLLAFTGLTWLAIRKLPGGKPLLLFYASLPIVLQEAASFSYDSIVNGAAILFISMCLYFALDKKPKKLAEILLLLYLMIFMASVKGGVYIPLCFLILLIPMEQGWRLKKRAAYLIALMILIVAAFAQNNIVGILKRFMGKENTTINPFSGSQMYSFGYLVAHPFKLVSLFVNTFFTETSRYVYEFLGGKMGSMYNIQMPWMYILVFLLILAAAFTVDFSGLCWKRTLSLAYCALVVFGSVLLVNFSMLIADTSMEYNSIQGVQGRYFIPCLLPLFMLGNYYFGRRKQGGIEKLQLLYYGTQLVFLFHIIMIVV